MTGRLSLAAGLGGAVLAAAAPGAATGRSAASPVHVASPPAQATVRGLVDQAQSRVFATHPACAPRTSPEQRTGGIHARPRPATLTSIAALRRPQTAAEAAVSASPGAPQTGGETYLDYVRTLTTGDGQRVTIAIGRSLPAVLSTSSACRRAGRAAIGVLARGTTATVRRRALALYDRRMREQSEASARTPVPYDTVAVLAGFGHGLVSASGGLPVARFRERGAFQAASGPGFGGRSALIGVLPDGVVSVTLRYPRTASGGADRHPHRYATPFTATVPVVDNVMSVTVPRRAGDVYAGRIMWRDVRGAVLRDAPLS